MKKALLVLLIALTALLLCAAIFPPGKTYSLSLEVEGEKIFADKVSVSLWHYLAAERAGGYLPLFNKLSAQYGSVRAMNYISEGMGYYLQDLSLGYEVAPTDATVRWTADREQPFVYTAAKSGKELNIAELGAKIAAVLDKGGGSVNAAPRQITAAITEERLRKETALRGTYKTSFATSGLTRRHNIELASSSINGTIVPAGEQFSFNSAVGERTEERGYMKAHIISNGEFVAGVGGGVCQVSTTLYNAALLSDMEIIQANSHSLPVHYVPLSRDAMVSSQSDLVMKNTTGKPCYILATVQGATLSMTIFGVQMDYDLELESVKLKDLPYLNKDDSGNFLTKTEGYCKQKDGKCGAVSRLYLISKKNGMVIDKRQIRENYYAPQHSKWALDTASYEKCSDHWRVS